MVLRRIDDFEDTNGKNDLLKDTKVVELQNTNDEAHVRARGGTCSIILRALILR